MKRFHVLSIVLGLALLGVLLWSIGLDDLLRDLGVLGWGLVPLILIQGVAEILHTFGWRRCLSHPHRALSFYDIFRIRMAGSAIDYLTPTASLGGEVIKGALLSFRNPGPGAASGVIVGKLSYSLAQLLFAVVGSIAFLWKADLPPGVWPVLLGVSALLGFGILAFLVVQRQGKLGGVVRWLVTRKIGGKRLATAAHHLTTVDEALKQFYRQQPMDLPLSVAWHMLGMSCGILQGAYFLFLLTGSPSFHIAAGVWFLGTWLDLVGFAVPSNIGVLEASRVLVFKVLGFDPALGLTYGVALRLEQLSWAMVGLAIYAWILMENRRIGAARSRNAGEGAAEREVLL